MIPHYLELRSVKRQITKRLWKRESWYLSSSSAVSAIIAAIFLFLLIEPGCKRAEQPVLINSASSQLIGVSSCTRDNEKLEFTNIEFEPHAAVDPRNSKHIVAIWVSPRKSKNFKLGKVHDFRSAFSTDGGKTWTETVVPFTACIPGGLDINYRAGDPWVSIGPEGRVYASTLLVEPPELPWAVAVCTSDDGGRSWNAPVIAYVKQHKNIPSIAR